MILSVQIPEDLSEQLIEAVKLGYPQFDKSEVTRECLRIGLPKLKKTFIARKQTTAKKISPALNKS